MVCIVIVVTTAILGPATTAHAFSPVYLADEEALVNTKTIEEFKFDASEQEALNQEITAAVKAKLAEMEEAENESEDVEGYIEKNTAASLAYAQEQASDIGKVRTVYVAPVSTTSNSTTYAISGPVWSMTAYSSSPDETSGNPFITASGAHVHWGTVACNTLPFGTRLRIPSLFGDTVFTVEDRGGFGHGLDIWFPSKAQALQFGRKSAQIEIL